MDQNISPIANILLDWKILLGFGLLGFVSIVNTKVAILPITSLTFLLTSIFIWFISLCTTFFCLHKLLQKNEPLQIILNNPKKLQSEKCERKANPIQVEQLSEDIDNYFINKWYCNISKNCDFTEESKLLLKEVLNRLAEVQMCVSNKLLLHGILNIYLKHLKEYRRSLKRKEKYDGNIEDLYRYSHLCSNSSKKAKEYFIHQLTTNVLRHFINSELWNSLPCTILISILARKMTAYLLKLASNPDIVSYIILNLVSSKSVKEKYELEKYARICVSQYYDITDTKEKPIKEQNNRKEIVEVIEESSHVIQSEPVLLENTESLENSKPLFESSEKIAGTRNIPNTSKKEILKMNEIKERKLVDKKQDAVEQKDQVSLHASSDPVKIHEPRLTKNTKTWRDSKDLGYGISLGQDPLDALPVTVESVRHVGKGTFWDTGKIEHFVEDSPLLTEMKQTTQTTMEGLKSSIKPISEATVNTLHNIKDLQESTMNNALHKIGDFQDEDEAAGMVEGILDFGRAGLRKGLRLTGLQDNIENAKASLAIGTQGKSHHKRKPMKMSKIDSPEKILPKEESLDSVWMNPLQMDSPNFDGQILLEKPMKSEEKEEKEFQIPFISMEQAQSETTSPDPEYEDTADLASSIAKLRSLLQQRSSESSMSTPALSPIYLLSKYYGTKTSWVVEKMQFFGTRPPDEFGQKASEIENVSDVDEVDGVMPSFYKFCAKTATGVLDKTLNTIKTALPGPVHGLEQSDNAWIFIQTDQNEADILTRMKKLLTERKEYCTLDTEIDTAYEAIDSLDVFQQPVCSNVEFEDELDDFEVKLPITKALVDIFCELLTDTNTPFVQEPVVKALLLALGNSIEECVISLADTAMENFCINLITIPEKSNQDTLFLDMDVYIEAVLSSLPDVIKVTFGKGTLSKALNLLISSLQITKINQDIVLQIFELISMKLIEESSQASPPASA